jgi:RNA polymerase sigma-70 factor (ECF subfamily)
MDRPQHDEAQLIRRAKAGDCDAFAAIYDQHHPAIYRYVLCRVSTAAVAEDLASEVFVRLVESIDDFTYQGRPLLAWLYTIARNLVHDHHRRRARTETVSLDDGLAASCADPESSAILTLDQEWLAGALRQLTDEQRQVILLRFFEGLDNETVAHIMDKSYGAVKALQHRGLEALRRAME